MSGMPEQEQNRQPGMTGDMQPRPRDRMEDYRSARRFEGKKVLVTGGDSGIGRAVAIGFAKEGADVAFVYLDEHEDARETRGLVEKEGVTCHVASGDLGDQAFARQWVADAVNALGGIDVLVNNAAEQHPQESFEDITGEQLEKTFRTNIFSMFYVTQAALAHLGKGGSIVNTTSITAYRGHPKLVDYASTKGAILAFTRSLSAQLAERGIRVNAVAPGPIWTPLIPSTFDAETVGKFGTETALGRPGQPDEVAPAFIFLASDDASYISGQVIHPNGGEVVNG